jgi:potassium efflux system protein
MIRRFFIALSLAVLCLGVTQAQDNPGEPRAKLEQTRTLLERIEGALRQPNLTVEGLGQLRTELDQIPEDLQTLIQAIEPEVKAIDERRTQLGPKPSGDQTEAAEVTREREEVQRRFSAADADLKTARDQSLRVDRLIERVVERRRELFASQLFRRSGAVVDPSFWLDVAGATPIAARGVGFLVADWLAVLDRYGRFAGAAVIAALLAVAILLFGPVRRGLTGFVAKRFVSSGADNPTPLQVSSHAAIYAILNAALPILGAVMVTRGLEALGLLPGRLAIVTDAVIEGLMVYAAIAAVAGAILCPGRANWRMLAMSDAAAGRAHATVATLGLVAAIMVALKGLSSAIIAPLPFVVATSSIGGLLFSGVLATGLAAISQTQSVQRKAAANDPDEPVYPASPAWRWLRIAMWIAAAVLFAASIAGYASFASFFVAQIVWGLVVIGVATLLTRLIEDVFTEVAGSHSTTARRLAGTIGVEASAVEQIGILSAGALRVLIIVLAGFLIVAPWGVDQRDAFGWLRAALFGVQLGGITISIAALVGAVVVFVLGLLATRAIQRWLDDRYLPATRMDAGLRNSIRTAAGYVGFVIAAVFAVSYMGLDVQNLAIVAGALSVGLGFGLQSIVNNFVSGLILLAERPIKAGDWIVVGDSEGYVRKINVRSTEIETFDRAVVIVPNSNLISGTVKNWMHNDLIGRVKVSVKVKRDMDAETVQAVLIEIARSHPFVLVQPAPKAYLMDIADSGLVFELHASVGNVDKAFRVRSDLRFEIVKQFKARNLALAGG